MIRHVQGNRIGDFLPLCNTLTTYLYNLGSIQ